MAEIKVGGMSDFRPRMGSAGNSAIFRKLFDSGEHSDIITTIERIKLESAKAEKVDFERLFATLSSESNAPKLKEFYKKFLEERANTEEFKNIGDEETFTAFRNACFFGLAEGPEQIDKLRTLITGEGIDRKASVPAEELFGGGHKTTVAPDRQLVPAPQDAPTPLAVPVDGDARPPVVAPDAPVVEVKPASTGGETNVPQNPPSEKEVVIDAHFEDVTPKDESKPRTEAPGGGGGPPWDKGLEEKTKAFFGRSDSDAHPDLYRLDDAPRSFEDDLEQYYKLLDEKGKISNTAEKLGTPENVRHAIESQHVIHPDDWATLSSQLRENYQKKLDTLHGDANLTNAEKTRNVTEIGRLSADLTNHSKFRDINDYDKYLNTIRTYLSDNGLLPTTIPNHINLTNFDDIDAARKAGKQITPAEWTIFHDHHMAQYDSTRANALLAGTEDHGFEHFKTRDEYQARFKALEDHLTSRGRLRSAQFNEAKSTRAIEEIEQELLDGKTQIPHADWKLYQETRMRKFDESFKGRTADADAAAKAAASLANARELHGLMDSLGKYDEVENLAAYKQRLDALDAHLTKNGRIQERIADHTDSTDVNEITQRIKTGKDPVTLAEWETFREHNEGEYNKHTENNNDRLRDEQHASAIQRTTTALKNAAVDVVTHANSASNSSLVPNILNALRSWKKGSTSAIPQPSVPYASHTAGGFAESVARLRQIVSSPEYKELPVLHYGKTNTLQTLNDLRNGYRVTDESWLALDNQLSRGSIPRGFGEKTGRFFGHSAIKYPLITAGLGVSGLAMTVALNYGVNMYDYSHMGPFENTIADYVLGALDGLSDKELLERDSGDQASPPIADKTYFRLAREPFTPEFVTASKALLGGVDLQEIYTRHNTSLKQNQKLENSPGYWKEVYGALQKSINNTAGERAEILLAIRTAISRNLGLTVGDAEADKNPQGNGQPTANSHLFVSTPEDILGAARQKYRVALLARLNGNTPEDIAYRDQFLSDYFKGKPPNLDDQRAILVKYETPGSRSTDVSDLDHRLVAQYLATRAGIQISVDDLLDASKALTARQNLDINRSTADAAAAKTPRTDVPEPQGGHSLQNAFGGGSAPAPAVAPPPPPAAQSATSGQGYKQSITGADFKKAVHSMLADGRYSSINANGKEKLETALAQAFKDVSGGKFVPEEQMDANNIVKNDEIAKLLAETRKAIEAAATQGTITQPQKYQFEASVYGFLRDHAP